MKAHFERFARYNRWANRRLYAAVAQLDSAAFTAPRSGFFPSIAKTLNHLLVADRIWLSRFEGTPNPHGALDETVCASFAALDAARETEDRRLIGFTRSLTAERLGAVLHFRTMAGEAKATPLEVALTHVFNHQAHHRGQAHAMLSGTAVPPPSIDLLYFLPEDAA